MKRTIKKNKSGEYVKEQIRLDDLMRKIERMITDWKLTLFEAMGVLELLKVSILTSNIERMKGGSNKNGRYKRINGKLS